jgi:hypothetical protein
VHGGPGSPGYRLPVSSPAAAHRGFGGRALLGFADLCTASAAFPSGYLQRVKQRRFWWPRLRSLRRGAEAAGGAVCDVAVRAVGLQAARDYSAPRFAKRHSARRHCEVEQSSAEPPARFPQPGLPHLPSSRQSPRRGAAHDGDGGDGEVDPQAAAWPLNFRSGRGSQLPLAVQLGPDELPSLLPDLPHGVAGGADAGGGAISGLRRGPPCGAADHSRRFFRVWSPNRLPGRADHPIYFGLANFI